MNAYTKQDYLILPCVKNFHTGFQVIGEGFSLLDFFLNREDVENAIDSKIQELNLLS